MMKGTTVLLVTRPRTKETVVSGAALSQITRYPQLGEMVPHPNHKTVDEISMVKDDEERGHLADSAASVLMKLLYAARVARFDLLRPVQGLAKWFTKWRKRHDDELYRLVCYIHTTKGNNMIEWFADIVDDIQPHLFFDSDFAGTEGTQTSTSGAHLCLRGPHTSFPLSGQSKRQGCVSQSITEAEIMAAALALTSAGLPVITIMEILKAASKLRGSPMTVLHFHVDNQAMAAVIRSGRNPTMRHLSRTHGICIAWLHEQCRGAGVQVEYVTTTLMAAGIYTKAFQDAVKWTNLCEQINLVEQSDLELPRIHALHSLLLTESSPVTGKKIHSNSHLMPEGLQGWDTGYGWHEREDIHYVVVREPNLYRIVEDPKYGNGPCS
jgi:hypothetical protein